MNFIIAFFYVLPAILLIVFAFIAEDASEVKTPMNRVAFALFSIVPFYNLYILFSWIEVTVSKKNKTEKD